MKIGVSSYSFSQKLKSGEMTQLDTIETAKKLGFDAIEFTDLCPPKGMPRLEYAKILRETAQMHGIEISAYVIGGDLAVTDKEERNKEVSRLFEELDVAKELGVSLFRHDIMHNYNVFRSFDEALPYLAEGIREVTDYAKGLNIRTMTENHGLICQEPERLERLLSAVDSRNYGLIVDIGNFMCADLKPHMAVARLCNLAFLVHAKDFTLHDFYDAEISEGFETRALNKLKGTAVGFGDARARQSLEIIKKSGYDGFVDVEYEGDSDCIQGLKDSLAFLKKVL